MKFIFEYLVFILFVVGIQAWGQPEGPTVGPGRLGFHMALNAHYQDHTNLCGGALISRELILTAAHCIYNADKIHVQLGLRDFQEGDQIDTIQVDKNGIILHEEFVDGNNEINNIALIKLPSPVTLNDNIQTVNLPTQAQMEQSFFENFGTLAGWDFFGDDKSSKRSTTMKMVLRNIIGAEDCIDLYPGFTTEINICLEGSPREKGCVGDSGSPLTISDNDYRTVIGIATYVGSKCDEGYPIVFTRVTAYMDWIASKIGLI